MIDAGLHRFVWVAVVVLALLPAAPSVQAAPARSFQIVCGDLPPFSMETGPDAPGALVEITRALAERQGVKASVKFFPWPRAQKLAQMQAHTLILPLTRTAERESRYRWVVKLYRQRFSFIAPSGSTFDIESVEVMRKLRLAVLRESPSMSVARARRFEHIVDADSPAEMVRMLKLGMVDAIFGSEAIHTRSLA